MTDPNGWPDASKPGVPKNPERSCTHRLAFPRGEHDWLWRAGLRPFWVTHTGRLVEPAELSSFRARYLGSCLTPAEVAAERAAAAEAMREACAARLEEMRLEHNAAMIGMWHSMDTALAYGDGAEAIRALPIPDASALAERDAARAEAAMATKRERARIVAALIDQADVTPCSEDRRVVFDCARLVLVDFSYDAADHLGDEDAIRRAAATASARAALAGEGREDGA